jgi:hypothetical protein
MRRFFASAILAAYWTITPAAAQTTFTIFPGTKLCTEPIPHTAIFTRLLTLTAGSVNHFFTTGTFGWFLQQASPDPVIALVSSSGTVVAFNDDFIGLDSDIIFTPATTGTFRLIVHSFSTPAAGFTNVMLSVNGAAPTPLGAATKFAGTHILTDWNSGIRFDTAGGNGDTVLILRNGRTRGATLLFNDDLGAISRIFSPGLQGALNSSITPNFSAHGGLTDNTATDAIVGSFSVNTEGETVLCQLFRSWMSPLLSPPRDTAKPSPMPVTSAMTRYLAEYAEQKPKLVEMAPDERDAAILALQRNLLSEPEIRTISAPASLATAAYIRAQNAYLARVKAREGELTKLGHDERAAELDKMKAETMGRALLQVEPDYGVSIDGASSGSPQ